VHAFLVGVVLKLIFDHTKVHGLGNHLVVVRYLKLLCVDWVMEDPGILDLP